MRNMSDGEVKILISQCRCKVMISNASENERAARLEKVEINLDSNCGFSNCII